MRRPALAVLLFALTAGNAAWAASQCQAVATGAAPAVVELYTSEGCSSCPPADRWLSSLKGRPDVLALAFHVNYWDQLGWADRFATPESTARQYALARQSGSGQVYTPQVVVNGRDSRAGATLPKATASTVTLSLARDGDVITAQVGPAAKGTLEGYWAVLEDAHESRVRAGENKGETLRHDGVVRLYKPVAAWPATAGQTQTLTVSRGVAEHPRQVVFVVTDPTTHQPVQAARLGC